MFTNGVNHRGKTPPSDFKVTIPKNPLLSKQAVTSKRIPVPYTNLQLNPYPNTQLDLFYNENLSFWCTTPNTWLTNLMHRSQYVAYSFARIQVRDYLSTWLTPQQPFDCCSWLAAASHRNTNKIFNVGARDFAWLQNPKAYKKRNKSSFFYKRRLWFQKENFMKLSRVRFFFVHLL